MSTPGPAQPPPAAPAWIAPESGTAVAFDIRSLVSGDDDGAPPGARTAAQAAIGTAGVAVARGDEPWPAALDGTDLGDANPLAAVEPVGVGGVLDGGFELLRVGFGRLVGLAAGLLLPLQLAEVLVRARSGLARPVEMGGSAFLGLEALGGDPTPLAWTFTALRMAVLSFLGLTAGVMVRELLEGRLPSGRRLLGEAGRRWWVAAVVPLLTTPAKWLGMCAVYVGWFLVDALLMCTSVAAGAERLGPLRAFGRSWTLARSAYGTALGVSVGGFAITMILQFVLLLGPAALVGMFTVSEGVLVLVQQVTSLVLLVTQPLTACIAARAYVELRCRSEALDLERRRIGQGLVGAGGSPQDGRPAGPPPAERSAVAGGVP